MTAEMIAWLRRQLDEDEFHLSHSDYYRHDLGAHCGGTRWEDEIAAKRLLLERYLAGDSSMGNARGYPFWNEPESQRLGEDIIRILAQPYAGRPGWKPEWKVEPGTEWV